MDATQCYQRDFVFFSKGDYGMAHTTAVYTGQFYVLIGRDNFTTYQTNDKRIWVDFSKWKKKRKIEFTPRAASKSSQTTTRHPDRRN